MLNDNAQLDGTAELTRGARRGTLALSDRENEPTGGSMAHGELDGQRTADLADRISGNAAKSIGVSQTAARQDVTTERAMRQQMSIVASRVEARMSAPTLTRDQFLATLLVRASQMVSEAEALRMTVALIISDDVNMAPSEMPLDAWNEWAAMGVDLDEVYDNQDERRYFGEEAR
jgi:hypothetical protein